MTTEEYMQALINIVAEIKASDEDGILVNLPAQQVRVTKHDARGLKVLAYIEQMLPDDATMADMLDVLDAGRWWAIYFGASIKSAPFQPDGGNDVKTE